MSDDLDELSRLHEAATPGRWHVEHGRIWDDEQGGWNPAAVEIASMSGSRQWMPDAALICAMRNALPKLIERVKAARSNHEYDLLMRAYMECQSERDEALKLLHDLNTDKDQSIAELSAENARLTAELAEAKRPLDIADFEKVVGFSAKELFAFRAGLRTTNAEELFSRAVHAEAEIKRLTDGIKAAADELSPRKIGEARVGDHGTHVAEYVTPGKDPATAAALLALLNKAADAAKVTCGGEGK